MKRKLTPQTHALDTWKVQIQQWRFSTCLMAIILAFGFNAQQLSAQAPVAVCQNITVAADANCQAVATVADFDGGSSDPNGDPLTFSVSPAGPYALGATSVTLSVSDSSNTTTCVATITVNDQSHPVPTAGIPPPTVWDEVIKATASNAGVDDYMGWSVSISGDKAIVGAYQEDTGGNDAGAAYIFERNTAANWIEVAKIVASDAQGSDQFGYSVSISGDKAIVGARLEDTHGINAGAAYIFERNAAGNWIEVAKIVASDVEATDYFGESVSISGGYAIVGAYREDTGGNNAGAAYIFEKNAAGNWAEVDKIVASDKQADDWFGYSVSISGDKAIVGAREEDTGGSNAGAAYIFERSTVGAWAEVAKIVSIDAEINDQFAWSVSISGDKAIVGAPLEDIGGTNTGAAYIFERSGAGVWAEVAKLVNSNAGSGDWFGSSVSISGDKAIVGVFGKDDIDRNAGTAYIYKKNTAGNWLEVDKIVASDAEANDYFGINVSISGDNVIVGASYEDTGGSNAGASYIFERPTLWTLPDTTDECSVTLTAPTATDNCTVATITGTTTDPTSYTTQGRDTVYWSFADGAGNVTIQREIVIINDTTNPTTICQPATIQINASGVATIAAADIDNGSTDACGIASLSVSPNTFDRTNLGANTVTLTVTDNNGNSSTCTAQVTVNVGVGIDDPIVNSLNLYPSPTADFINLQSTVNRKSDLQLYISDATGRVVWRGFLPKGAAKQMRIDVGKLATGIYILHAKGGSFSPIKWVKI